MKQINDKLNMIAKAIDETVELPETNLITDSLDAITKALGGTPNDSNLIVDKLDDIAGVAEPKPTGNIELTENGENIDIAQYATATVSVSGGGDSAPFPYVTIHIVNEDADADLYASYRDSGYYLGNFLHSNFDNELDYYLPSVGYSSYQFVDGTILAEKDGGTAEIYTLNKLISFFESGQVVNINGVFSCINGLSALTFTDMVNMSIVRQTVYSGDTYDIYGLTDSTQNGEITIKINAGGR